MEDILRIILSQIDCGSDFKSARLVCRAWRDITQKLFPDGHLRFANHLQTIIEKMLEYIEDTFKKDIIKYHDIKHKFFAHFHRLNSNPNITWDFIKKHPELPWSLPHLMKEIEVTDELVDMMVAYNISCKANPRLSWDSLIKVGNYIYPSKGMAPALTPEILKHIEANWTTLTSRRRVKMNFFIHDDVLASYGTEEVIVSRQLFKNSYISSNPYLSCDFVLKHCGGENIFIPIIKNNLIRLHQRGVLVFNDDKMPDFLSVRVDTSSMRSSYPIDPNRPVVFKIDIFWNKLSCEVHRYVCDQTDIQGYCSKCASPEDVEMMIEDDTIDWKDLIKYNHDALDIESLDDSILISDDKLFIEFGPFEIIKKRFSSRDYSKNLNVPLQYVADHCPGRQFICERSDLTWEFVMKHVDEKWIDFNDIWSNKFGKA